MHKFSFTIPSDAAKNAKTLFKNIDKVPTYVIIDKDGYIQYTSSLSLSLGQLERDLYMYTGLYETEDSDISPSPMISNLAIVVSIVVLVIVVSIRHQKTIRL